MNAHFCSKTGVRIVAPGVSKAVDPENGQNECLEGPDGKLVVVEPKPEKGSKKPKEEQPASAEAGSEPKPEKGSK